MPSAEFEWRSSQDGFLHHYVATHRPRALFIGFVDGVVGEWLAIVRADAAWSDSYRRRFDTLKDAMLWVEAVAQLNV